MQMTGFKLTNVSLNKLDEDGHVKVAPQLKMYRKLLYTTLTKGADSARPIHVQHTETFTCIFSSFHIFLSLIRRSQTNNKSLLKATFNEKLMFSFHSKTMSKRPHRASIIFQDTKIYVLQTKQNLRNIKRCL